MNKADITCENNTILLSGKVDFFNVMSVYQQSLSFIVAQQAFTIDCTHLQEANSAVIALLIEWIKHAKAIAASITFRGLSPDLLVLAKAANLDDLLTSGSFSG
jgi:phospholipid transport system transporter-binding protein